MHKPILCLDFDGVCHSYVSGWIDAWTIPDPPVEGLFEFLIRAVEQFQVAIYSTRSEQQSGRAAMREWLVYWATVHYKHKMGDDYHEEAVNKATDLVSQVDFPSHKPPALVTLDDRAVTFTGHWPDVGQLREFKPWNEHLKRRKNSEKGASDGTSQASS